MPLVVPWIRSGLVGAIRYVSEDRVLNERIQYAYMIIYV